MKKVQHRSRDMTINEIRSNGIWILGCSSEVSSLIYKFIKCRKLRKCNHEQRMTDLPPERIILTLMPFLTHCIVLLLYVSIQVNCIGIKGTNFINAKGEFLELNGPRMFERVRLYLCHDPTCFQSHRWCLGETDLDCIVYWCPS